MGQNGFGATRKSFWGKRNGLRETGKKLGNSDLGENGLLYVGIKFKSGENGSNPSKIAEKLTFENGPSSLVLMYVTAAG